MTEDLSEYPKPENARNMSTTDLIEWLAQIAYDAREDWGWIADELLARIPEHSDRCIGAKH